MPIPESFIEEVTARNDIVDVVSSYVNLTKTSGNNKFGLCPFHSEDTPSFCVNRAKQMYYCFGCNKGGGVVNFIMEEEHLSFPEAVEFLAERVGMHMPETADIQENTTRKRMLALNKDAALFFREKLFSAEGEKAREYVSNRRLTSATVNNFGIGYAPDDWNSLTKAMREKGYSEEELLSADLCRKGRNGGIYDTFRDRLMFPVISVRKEVLGFSGRALNPDARAKYMNSSDTPVYKKSRQLFALNLAKNSRCGYIILAEGNIDVASLHQAGFDSAVASLGTALTPEQARLIAGYTNEVIIAYDSDEAGVKAAQRAITILEKLDIKVRVLQMEGAKDPDEYIKLKGADAFRNLIESSEDQIEFRLSRINSKYDLSRDEDRVAYIKEAVALVARFPGKVERVIYSERIAENARTDKAAVSKEVERVRSVMQKSAKRRLDTSETRPIQQSGRKSIGINYTNPESAACEEQIIGKLAFDPACAAGIELPSPELFTSPELRKIYTVITENIKNGESLNINLLGTLLTQSEISLFTSITQSPGSSDTAGLQDCIDRLKSLSSQSEMDLNKLAETLRERKSYR
ncbi:MAG: DNA primase [Oscillospiraceae bacterium]|nr:DNA primase [Oscillospiraceae bacterium]